MYSFELSGAFKTPILHDVELNTIPSEVVDAQNQCLDHRKYPLL